MTHKDNILWEICFVDFVKWLNWGWFLGGQGGTIYQKPFRQYLGMKGLNKVLFNRQPRQRLRSAYFGRQYQGGKIHLRNMLIYRILKKYLHLVLDNSIV